MSFLNMGDHGWINESENETERMNETLNQQDLLTGKVLSLLQKVVANYVNIGNHAALDGLQACLSEVMRQASEAMQKGVKMEIDSNMPDDVH